MWTVVMFDLPTHSKLHRERYRKFRKFLLDEGFNMLQYSVYGRHCPTREKAEHKQRRITHRLPPQGEVRILQVTEAQFSRMQVFRKSRSVDVESAPDQLEFWGT